MERDYYSGGYEGGDSWESEEKEGRLRSALQRAMGSFAVKLNNTRIMKFINEPWLTIEFPHGEDPLREAEIRQILKEWESDRRRGGNQSR